MFDKKKMKRRDRVVYRLGWAGACTNPTGFISLLDILHALPIALRDYIQIKPVLIPLPTVTSFQPHKSMMLAMTILIVMSFRSIRVRPPPNAKLFQAESPTSAFGCCLRWVWVLTFAELRRERKCLASHTASLKTNEIQFSELRLTSRQYTLNPLRLDTNPTGPRSAGEPPNNSKELRNGTQSLTLFFILAHTYTSM